MTDTPLWLARLRAAKQHMLDRRQIRGDEDLAAATSEYLVGAGHPPVKRAALNHWLTGTREMGVAQFLALCKALHVTPGDMLADELHGSTIHFVREERIPYGATSEVSELVKALADADAHTRSLAIDLALRVIRAAQPPAQNPARLSK